MRHSLTGEVLPPAHSRPCTIAPPDVSTPPPPAAREAVRAGASVKLGCDHTHYPAHVAIAAETLASLAGDLN